MLETLANLQPLILIIMIVLLYNLESFIPYLQKPRNKKKHDINNFILSIISFVINGIAGLGIVYTLTLTEKNNFGLLNHITLPSTVEIILGMLLIDFGSYMFHNVQHRISFFWKFHSIHHSDLNLNASSSLRFHPVDVILSQGIWPSLWIMVMGISMTSFIIYGTIALPLLIMQHSNIKLPVMVEKYGRLIFSTPGWHKIHHSDEQKLTDSHYGDVFTFWDRIFGTWHKAADPEKIHYGLQEFSDEKQQSFWYLLKYPFIRQKSKNYNKRVTK